MFLLAWVCWRLLHVKIEETSSRAVTKALTHRGSCDCWGSLFPLYYCRVFTLHYKTEKRYIKTICFYVKSTCTTFVFAFDSQHLTGYIVCFSRFILGMSSANVKWTGPYVALFYSEHSKRFIQLASFIQALFSFYA